MAESGKERRDKAAAARAAQVAAEKRRERTIRIIGAIAVVVVVVGIIGIAVFASRGGSGGEADPAAAIPTGVIAGDQEYAYGFPVNDATGVPTLELWEDFQCPACAQLEAANGAGIRQLATDGKIRLIYRPATFLDRNLKNDASARATAAYGCAINAGKGVEFHDTLFANQPTSEGTGWTDEQLLGFGQTSGITGDAYNTFATCYNDRTYLGWANNSQQIFETSQIPGTPAGFLNGLEISSDVLADQAKLEAAIAEAQPAQ